MVTGCCKRLNYAKAGDWAYLYTDENRFKVGDYVFAEAPNYPDYPCGVPQEWCGRPYIPLCIRCAKKNGFIW